MSLMRKHQTMFYLGGLGCMIIVSSLLLITNVSSKPKVVSRRGWKQMRILLAKQKRADAKFDLSEDEINATKLKEKGISTSDDQSTPMMPSEERLWNRFRSSESWILSKQLQIRRRPLKACFPFRPKKSQEAWWASPYANSRWEFHFALKDRGGYLSR